jgi:aminoglycoside phosphotransferase (APT) family kinase protein
MKINSTELNLSLALHSLEQTVLPDATSEAARGAIANIRLTLIDLLKRQGPAIPFLQECINEGEDLCRQIHQLLGSVPENLPIAIMVSTEQSFDALIKIHEKLTEEIQNLSGQLLGVKVFTPDVGVTLRKAAHWEQNYYVGMSKLTPLPFGEDPATTPPTAPPLTADFLRSFLRSQRQDDSIEVIDFRSIPGGYGNQTFFCTLSYNTDQGVEDEEIVVRKSDGMPIVLPLEQEYDLLRCLSLTNFPVAKPFELASKLPGVDGTFYTMGRLSGTMASSYVNGAKNKLEEKLLLRLAELLGQLHSMPLNNFKEYISAHDETSVYTETVEEGQRRKLLYWKKYSQDVKHPSSPFVVWLFDWLSNNIPADSRFPVLTHGDFNVHNVLSNGTDVEGILDWECAEFGAPEMDLAYIHPTVSAHMDWEVFLDHYYKHGGIEINSPSMLFCSAYQGLRLALAAGRFTLSLQNGINRDIRFINVEQSLTAAIMAMGLEVTKGTAEAPIAINH